MASKEQDLLTLALSGKLPGSVAASSSENSRPNTLLRPTQLRLNSNDRDDLRFELRKNKRRVEELYEGRSFYDLEVGELQLARKVIVRETQEQHAHTTAPAFTRPPTYAAAVTSGAAVGGAVPVRPSLGPSSILNNRSVTFASSVSSGRPASASVGTTNTILNKLYSQDARSKAGSSLLSAARVPSGSVSSSSTVASANWQTTTRPSSSSSVSAHSTASTTMSMPVTHRLDGRGPDFNANRSTSASSYVSSNSSVMSSVSSSSMPTVRRIGTPSFDYAALMANVAKDQRHLRESQQSTSVTKTKKEQQKQQVLSEVDALLNRKSSHATEADDEWFAQYQDRVKKLSQREFMQEKSNAVKFVEIKAFLCRDCENFISEAYPNGCQDMGHRVSEITAVKRFFECGHCAGRAHTLMQTGVENAGIPLPPKHRCRCGEYCWQVKGTVKRTESVQSLTGEAFVASASESTSRKDGLAMAMRVSKLSEQGR